MQVRKSHYAQLLQVIVVSGLVPLLGLIFWGWDWRQVVVFYWLGNISGGIMVIIDMIRAKDYRLAGADTTELGRTILMASKVGSLVFFTMHYGIFTLVHGVFVFLLVSGGMSQGVVGSSSLGLGGIILAWLVPTIVTVVVRILRPAPRLSFSQITTGVYKRIIVLHSSIIFGAMAISQLQLPSAAAFVLIGMTVAVELFMNRRKDLNTPEQVAVQDSDIITQLAQASGNSKVVIDITDDISNDTHQPR